MTNPRPAQIKLTKPNDFYASKYQKLTVSDMKAWSAFEYETWCHQKKT